jgi:apolipoprotein N-acyltransferase
MLYLPKMKILLSILSGVMLTMAFPPGKPDWIIWVSIIPLLKSIENENMSTAFRLGIITGLTHYITLLYWITNVLSTYGGLNIIFSISLLVLLCLYLSVYTGIFAMIVSKLDRSPFMVITIAGIWVALEYLRTFLFTGFPWCLLGHSQYGHLSLIQIADMSGVYGISFLIVCVNVTGFLLFPKKDPELNPKKPIIVGLILSSILISGTIMYGNYRLKEHDDTSKKENNIVVAIVQGNIDQSIKWERGFQRETIEKYMSLTRPCFKWRPKIIVWPETAIPFFFNKDKPESKQLYKIPMESGANFIFGCPAYKRENGKTEYFNRVIYISPEGKIEGQYDKNHLVPFGEYVPLKKLLPFVYRLVPSAGDFSSGNKIIPLQLPGLPSGVLICYEIIFPDISREHVMKGAKILINLTNDAWFGFSSAPYQHLYMSLFRAIENRRPIIRAANTGFSAFIDPCGRILKRGELFTEEILIGRIIPADNPITFYTRYGDIFAYSMIILCLIKFLYELCYGFFSKNNFHEEV